MWPRQGGFENATILNATQEAPKHADNLSETAINSSSVGLRSLRQTIEQHPVLIDEPLNDHAKTVILGDEAFPFGGPRTADSLLLLSCL